MRAGQLRHRITIDSKTAVSPSLNNIGEADTTWTTFHTCWASIKAAGRGKEQIAAEAIESNVDTEIFLRYHAGVLAGMRVLHGTQYYDIAWVDNKDERNQMLTLHCTRGNSRG